VSSPGGITIAELYKERGIRKFVKCQREYDNGTFCVFSKVSHAASENEAFNCTTKMSQMSYIYINNETSNTFGRRIQL